MFAPASFGGMHRLAAKLLHEEIRVFPARQNGKHSTIPFAKQWNGRALKA
jgi:hypothetical protein